MKYKVKAWIPVDPEAPELNDNIDDAIEERDQAQMIQPENVYIIMECENDGSETGREIK